MYHYGFFLQLMMAYSSHNDSVKGPTTAECHNSDEQCL